MEDMLLNIESNTKNANMVKNMVLGRLLYDEIISEEEQKDYETNWQMILIKKSWFSKLVSKDKNPWVYKLVNFSTDEPYIKDNSITL